MSVTQPSIKRVLLTSFLVDVIDITTNLVVAIMTGSAVMLAEMLEGAADLAAVGLVLIGARRSQHKANAMHPFGYGKELYFWSTLAAFVMLAITATLSVLFGYRHLIHPEEVHNLPLAYGVLVLAIGTNGYSWWVSSRKLLAGRSWRQLPRMFMTSWQIAPKITFVLDSIGTSAAIIGFVALWLYGVTSNQQFDGLGAMVMGVTLGMFAVLLLVSVRSLVTGRAAPADVRSKVRRAALSVPRVREVDHVRTMILSADSMLIAIEVHLQNDLSTDQIETIVKQIRRAVQATTSGDAQVYVEPVA